MTSADTPSLDHVGGDLVFSASRFSAMDGLSGLRTIGGKIQINSNQSLTDITGLYGVTSVGGDLVIESNPNLPSGQATGLVEAIGSSNIGGVVVVTENGPG